MLMFGMIYFGMFIIGIINYNECHINPMIPKWLIVMGSMGIFGVLFRLAIAALIIYR
jgi:hypothetical protein